MRKSIRTIAVCAAVIATFAIVGPALAQTTGPAPDAVFYELTENMKLVQTVGTRNVQHRVAVSALAGVALVGTPFCPADLVQAVNPGATKCDLTALGNDNVNVTTGKGPFNARIAVVVQGDNPNDAPEFVVDQIQVGGPMDFSPALMKGLPYGTVSGFIKDRSSGTVVKTDPFIGVFRLPFVAGVATRAALCPLTPNVNPNFPGRDLAYVDTTPEGQLTGRCVDIRPDELSINQANVRFDIWFK